VAFLRRGITVFNLGQKSFQFIGSSPSGYLRALKRLYKAESEAFLPKYLFSKD
jgi:hypothetical protein